MNNKEYTKTKRFEKLANEYIENDTKLFGKMNNKEEAEKAWKEKAIEKSHGLLSFAQTYQTYMVGVSDFKAALIQAFKNEVDQTLSEMEEFRKDSNDIDYNVCQTKVNTLNLMITKINETKPL